MVLVKFLGRKVVQSIVVLFIVTLGAAGLTELIPGSPAALILGDTSQPEAVAKINAEYGFDRPFFVRYWSWIGDLLHGDIGTSVQSNEKVLDVLVQHLPVTLQIALTTLVVALLIAVPVATLCAAREGSPLDRAVTALCSSALAIPSFVGCVILAELLSNWAGLFPTFGWVPITDDLGQNLLHAAMPVMVMAFTIAALFTRVLRADLVGVLREDFVLAARARGMSTAYIMLRHALRPACLSLFTLTGLVFGYLLGGSIIVENYFSLPGVGQVVAQAVSGKDLAVVQGVVVLVALVFLVLNTVVDLGYALIDPQMAVKL